MSANLFDRGLRNQQTIAAGSCAGSTMTLTGNGLDGVTAVVTCTSTAHTGGTVCRITSTAERGTFGSVDYAIAWELHT